MKRILDIGCGQAKTPGAIGLDINLSSQADVIADVNRRPWPFADECFELIICRHIVEHVDDLVGFMEEVHRIALPGALVEIITPHFSNRYSYVDPTHVRHLSWRSWDYFTRESVAIHPTLWERFWEIRHPIPAFYTSARFRLLKRFLDFGRPYRLLGIQRFANCYPDLYESYLAFIFPARDLYVTLEVIK